jgi:misacylated tRNA(Ala) deacylase
MDAIIEINKPSPKFQDVLIAPMHTAEHLLNATMVKMFGCTRSRNAHIEKKKSKCDYQLLACPSDEEIQSVEDKVNEVINRHLPVTMEFVSHDQTKQIVGLDLNKLPEDASETLRIVRIGDYDVCACIGLHVNNTSEVGTFKIISHDWNDGTLRLRFKLL